MYCKIALRIYIVEGDFPKECPYSLLIYILHIYCTYTLTYTVIQGREMNNISILYAFKENPTLEQGIQC